VDYVELIDLLHVPSIEQLQQCRFDWVDESLQRESQSRNPLWTDAIAAGSESFVMSIQNALKSRQTRSRVEKVDEAYVLREAGYPLYRVFGFENTI